jgi:hypothetical protein
MAVGARMLLVVLSRALGCSCSFLAVTVTARTRSSFAVLNGGLVSLVRSGSFCYVVP